MALAHTLSVGRKVRSNVNGPAHTLSAAVAVRGGRRRIPFPPSQVLSRRQGPASTAFDLLGEPCLIHGELEAKYSALPPSVVPGCQSSDRAKSGASGAGIFRRRRHRGTRPLQWRRLSPCKCLTAPRLVFCHPNASLFVMELGMAGGELYSSC